MKNFIGEKYGKLTVVKKTRKNKNGKWFYSCICECGNTKEVLGESLRSGNTTSCGCVRTEMLKSRAKEMGKNNLKDLTGKKFGRLTVLCCTDKRCNNNSAIWECMCDCGNKTLVKSSHLIDGRTKSCGCYNKENLQRIYNEEFVESTKLGALNQKIPKNNTSGAKGVYWETKTQTWKTMIWFQGKGIYLGRYKKFEDAVKARKKAEEEYFEPVLNRHGKELKVK